MLVHFGGKLVVRHSASCHHLYGQAAKFLRPDVLTEFALGFTRTKDQQRVCTSNARQHFFIDLLAATHQLSLAPIFRNKIMRRVLVLRA